MNIKKFLAILLVAIIAVSVFAGCDVITKNEERDYSQSLAIIEYNGLKAEVTKGEFLESYNSYAYYYVYYYGYTVEDTANEILNSLAQRELLLLYVRDKIAGDMGLSNNVDVVALLSDVEKNEAVKSANETIKGFYDDIYDELWEETHLDEDTDEDEDEEEEEESTYLEARSTRPDVAEAETDYTKPLADEDKEEQFFVKAAADESFLYDKDWADDEREERIVYVKKALNQLKKELAENYKSYEYYLEGAYETELLSKYQRSFGDSYTLANATEAIQAKFDKYVTLNKEAFAVNTESNYQSALSDLTTLAYAPKSELGYGYVYNILFKFSDAQTTALTNFSTDNGNEQMIADYRDALAKEIITHKSNLDFDADEEIGEGNYAYEMTDDKKSEKEFKASDVITSLRNDLSSATTFKDKLSKVIDYTYMYNDDSGMFDSNNDNAITNNYLGYLITPEGKTSSYVDEFTELGRALIAGTTDSTLISKYNIEGSGLGAYGYCVTDYGIHFMFVSYVPFDADSTTLDTDGNATLSLDKVVAYADTRTTDADTTLKDAIFETLKSEYQSNQYQINAQSVISEKKDSCIKKQSKVWDKLLDELTED